jgi:hypothetical protein
MSEPIPGTVVSVGPRFGFVRDAFDGDYYFSVDRLEPGVRLWPGDKVTFVPLTRTASTSRRPGGKPLATQLRRA